MTRERTRERRPEATASMSSRIPIGLIQSPLRATPRGLCVITKYHERHRLAPQDPEHLCQRDNYSSWSSRSTSASIV